MKTSPTATKAAHTVEQEARSVATNKWMTRLARLGYVMKGVVYIVIGVLAVALAIGHGGAATDQRGALRIIYEQPFGKFLLVIVGIGLIGYALWSFIEAIFDTEGKGKDAKGIIGRVAYAAVGVIYALLAFGAFQLVLGTGNGGQSSTTSTQDWTALLLKQPLGVVLVIIVGLIALAIAVAVYVEAYKASFQRHLALTGIGAQLRKWIIWSGRLGYAAQGVVFTIIGLFFIIAALQHNPGQAKGLDGALQELLHQPFGPLLLAIVAIGFIAYGIYSFVEARYRRVGRG